MIKTASKALGIILISTSPAFAQATGGIGPKIALIGGGAILSLVGIVLAYAANYYLNVRRTTSGGAIVVNNFRDYMKYNALKFVISTALILIILGGILLILIGLLFS